MVRNRAYSLHHELRTQDYRGAIFLRPPGSVLRSDIDCTMKAPLPNSARCDRVVAVNLWRDDDVKPVWIPCLEGSLDTSHPCWRRNRSEIYNDIWLAISREHAAQARQVTKGFCLLVEQDEKPQTLTKPYCSPILVHNRP